MRVFPKQNIPSVKKKVLKYQKHHSTGMSSFMIKVLKINDTLGEINNRNYRNL